MNFHTKLVGAFDAIILCTLAAATILMTVALLDPSLVTFDSMGKRGTVTIDQIS